MVRPWRETWSPVAPMWYLTSPPPRMLRGSTSSKPAKISAAGRPTVCAMTFSRPRWLIASTTWRAWWSAALSSISSSSGRSASTPSIEKRLVPR